jgi:hypothetical protein
MTAPQPTKPDTVTLMVAEDDVAAGRAAWRSEEVREDFAEHALPLIGRRLVKAKEVSFDKLEGALQNAQKEVAALLRGVTHPDVPGFRLSSVDIELSVSAEGSIGVATAGAEASITLSFERDHKRDPPAATGAEGT